MQGEFTVKYASGETIVKKAGESYIGVPNTWHTAMNMSAEKTILVGTVLGIEGEAPTINK